MPYASKLPVELPKQPPFDGIDLGLAKRDVRHSPEFTTESQIGDRHFTEGVRTRAALGLDE